MWRPPAETLFSRLRKLILVAIPMFFYHTEHIRAIYNSVVCTLISIFKMATKNNKVKLQITTIFKLEDLEQ